MAAGIRLNFGVWYGLDFSPYAGRCQVHSSSAATSQRSLDPFAFAFLATTELETLIKMLTCIVYSSLAPPSACHHELFSDVASAKS